MKLSEIDTVSLPTYAIVYLEYGDHSGLEADDITAIDNWREEQAKQCKGQLHLDYSEDHYFSTNPEFGLPCDCVDCTITDLY